MNRYIVFSFHVELPTNQHKALSTRKSYKREDLHTENLQTVVPSLQPYQ